MSCRHLRVRGTTHRWSSRRGPRRGSVLPTRGRNRTVTETKTRRKTTEGGTLDPRPCHVWGHNSLCRRFRRYVTRGTFLSFSEIEAEGLPRVGTTRPFTVWTLSSDTFHRLRSSSRPSSRPPSRPPSLVPALVPSPVWSPVPALVPALVPATGRNSPFVRVPFTSRPVS